MKEVNFLNLTNGLEFIDRVDNPQFLRIRSTTLERKDYWFLMMDLDHNFLMNAALGNQCNIYDCGTNRNLSKTIYLGVPFIRYCLQRRWLGVFDKPYRFSRCGTHKFNIDRYFDELYNELFVWNQNASKSKLKTKLDYYKRYIISDTVRISGHSISTRNDGKKEYWKSKVYGFDEALI